MEWIEPISVTQRGVVVDPTIQPNAWLVSMHHLLVRGHGRFPDTGQIGVISLHCRHCNWTPPLHAQRPSHQAQNGNSRQTGEQNCHSVFVHEKMPLRACQKENGGFFCSFVFFFLQIRALSEPEAFAQLASVVNGPEDTPHAPSQITLLQWLFSFTGEENFLQHPPFT